MKLAVKVTPGASRNALLGWHGEALKLAVTAVPERGKANAAVQALLAETLRLPKSAISLRRGDTQSQKLFEIAGLDDATARHRIDEALR
ncbi:DUF167 domain-containing protein [Solimonas soli]|uniref:DUF167 domain-containing protein n=1 Tax=Solimonas soli TaxID=413479 RepID=UPI000483EC32|nr:DUF167 domain-containing protein [Solimonas soli]